MLHVAFCREVSESLNNLPLVIIRSSWSRTPKPKNNQDEVAKFSQFFLYNE
jgi:hypothetical protein